MQNPCLWRGVTERGSIIISLDILVVVSVQRDTNCGVDSRIETIEMEATRYKLGPYRASNVAFLSSQSKFTVLTTLVKHAIAGTVGKHVFVLTAATSKFQGIDYNIFNYGFMGFLSQAHLSIKFAVLLLNGVLLNYVTIWLLLWF